MLSGHGSGWGWWSLSLGQVEHGQLGSRHDAKRGTAGAPTTRLGHPATLRSRCALAEDLTTLLGFTLMALTGQQGEGAESGLNDGGCRGHHRTILGQIGLFDSLREAMSTT